MLEKIKSFIRETRIKFHYPKFESEQSIAHQFEAERRFDSSRLQREVYQIKLDAIRAGEQQFGDEICPLRKRFAALERDLQQKIRLLAIFERNYKSELNNLYDKKEILLRSKKDLLAQAEQLRGERSQAHQELDAAYKYLENAKSDVGRWYSKAERTPWLFGNGGKKIPKHSMFGQSFGDLKAAKSRRGDAVNEIDACNRRIATVKGLQSANRAEIDRNRSEIGEIFDRIAEVKAARQGMFDLRSEGVQPEVLQQCIRQLESSKSSVEERILDLENRRSALVEETQIRMGLREREATIADLLLKKKQFLDSFHSAHSKAARQDRHRRQWMESRGYDTSK